MTIALLVKDEDIKQAINLRKIAWKDSGNTILNEWEWTDELDQTAIHVGCIHNGLLIGSLRVTIHHVEEKLPIPHELRCLQKGKYKKFPICFWGRLAVKSEYSRYGIGGRLIVETESILKSMKLMKWQTWTSNERVRKFMMNRGWDNMESTFINWGDTLTTGYLMKKDH